MRLFILFFLLSSNLIAQKFNQTDSKGLKQGAWRKFYDNGRLELEGNFIDGKPTGIFRYYYDNGSKKALIEHNATTGRSLANFFHPNGQLMSGGIYRNQLKDSTWITFTENGLVSEISNYQNNELHGPRTTYYISGLEGSKERIERLNWKFDYYISKNERNLKDTFKNLLLLFGIDLNYKNYKLLRKK